MTYLFFSRLLLPTLSFRTSSGNNARRTIPAWTRQASPFFHGSQVIKALWAQRRPTQEVSIPLATATTDYICTFLVHPDAIRVVTRLERAVTKRGLNSNASNTTLASLLRGWKEERRGENRERGQASCTSSPTARPPARPPARRRPPDAATTAVGGERSRVLPQEEGGSDASNARPLLAAETPNDDDATRIAPAGNGKGGESLTLLNCS